MTTTTERKLRAEIVLAYLECAAPDQTASEIGNATSMRKRQVQDALWMLLNRNEIEYGKHRAGEGLTYRLAAVRER